MLPRRQTEIQLEIGQRRGNRVPRSRSAAAVAGAELHHRGRVVDRRIAAGGADRGLVDPRAASREQAAQHQPRKALRDMAGLPVLRMPRLPERPNTKTKADRCGEVAGHAERGRTGVDRLRGHRVELRADAARRRGRGLRHGMANHPEAEGKPAGKSQKQLALMMYEP
jgi:hypothetical protein